MSAEVSSVAKMADPFRDDAPLRDAVAQLNQPNASRLRDAS
jgi:hypothetical protein